MASRTCLGCLRGLRRASFSIRQLPVVAGRTFATTPSYFVALPESSTTAAASIPPVTPRKASGDLNSAKTKPMIKVAQELRRVTGRATETYTVYGVAEDLYKECARQADYSIPQALEANAELPKTDDGEDLGIGEGWWHTELGLKPTFSTWSHVTMLHMYALSVRFRCLPADQCGTWQQHLVDHFFHDAENRMAVNHHMHVRGMRGRYLKDLFVQWRGLLAAYDEGLVKGDAVLAAAVWRNLFKADEEVDIGKLAVVIGYLRRTLKSLEALPDEIIQTGGIVFGDPGKEAALVGQRSPMMSLPFGTGES